MLARNEAKFSTKSAVLFVKASSVMSGKELPKSTCFATNFFRGVIHPDQVNSITNCKKQKLNQ